MAIKEPSTHVTKDVAVGRSENSGSATKTLEALFRFHYTGLCRYSLYFVKQHELAEEIVQDVFVAFWKKNNAHITQQPLEEVLEVISLTFGLKYQQNEGEVVFLGNSNNCNMNP
jgi:hypothetical protein